MPFGGNLHISRALTNISIAYVNEEYIAGDVLMNLPVKKETDQIYTFSRDNRIVDTYRANKSPANFMDWSLSTTAYSLNEHAVADIITERDKENSDLQSIERTTTEILTDALLRTIELEAVQLLFTTTAWSGNSTLNTATSFRYNTSTSAPIEQVLSATAKILTE